MSLSMTPAAATSEANPCSFVAWYGGARGIRSLVWTPSPRPRPSAGINLLREQVLRARPIHWPSLTETERPQAFADLREWVEPLVDRFAIEIRVIPPCWYRHNGMVEALSALRNHERMSFSDHGSAYGRRDWAPMLPVIVRPAV